MGQELGAYSLNLEMWHFRALLLCVCAFAISLTKAKTVEEHESSHWVKSIPCPGIPAWFTCPNSRSGLCVSPSQLCDGRSDCSDSDWDESPEVCDNRACPEGGVRCQTGGVCLRVPYRHVCNGGHRARCPDHSDVQHCLHKIYTGCFINDGDGLGLRIAPCQDCLCRLKKANATSQGDTHATSLNGSPRIFKSVAPNHRGSRVVGDICLRKGTSSSLLCDGVEDCVDGEDEHENLCGRARGLLREAKEMSGFEMARSVNRKSVSQVFPKHKIFMAFTAIVVSITVALYALAGFLAVSCARRIKRKWQERLPFNPDTEANSGTGSPTRATEAMEMLPTSKDTGKPVNTNWSWNCATLIRELGRGYYGTVYLAEELNGRLVAVKSSAKKRASPTEETSGSSSTFSHECSVLKEIGRHLNVIKLVGHSDDKTLLAFEYCQHGSLKDYVEKNRAYYINDLDLVSGEISSYLSMTEPPYGTPGSTSSRTGNGGSTANLVHMSDFLCSLHTKLEPDRATTIVGIKPGGAMAHSSRHLFNTRRFLAWTMQIARGMEYLSSKGIIHGDLALRNLLLTNSDLVKISDFGLSVRMTSSSTSSALDLSQIRRKARPLPWMAPECVLAGPTALSTKSDVWAFGVSLWELFTLGKTPHADLKDNQLELTLREQDGVRALPEAELAPKTVGRVMAQCWAPEPVERPDFPRIVRELKAYINGGYRGARSRVSQTPDCCYGYVPMESVRTDTSRRPLTSASRSDRLQQRWRSSLCDSDAASTATSCSGGALDGSVRTESIRIASTPTQGSLIGSEEGAATICYWNGYKIMKNSN